MNAEEIAEQVIINSCDCVKECHCEWNGPRGVQDRCEKLIVKALESYAQVKTARYRKALEEIANDIPYGEAHIEIAKNALNEIDEK